MRNIPFFKPSINNKEINEVGDVLDYGSSNKVESLEKKFKRYIGSEYAISTTTGTSAIHLALCSMDLKRGDKIICPVNTPPAIAETIRHFDAEPIFIDVNEDDFNISVEDLEEFLSHNKPKKLRAIFVSHIGGQVASLQEIVDIAEKYKLKVIEDASYAMGATYNGDKIGSTLSDITIFSFSSQLTGDIAKGGMITTFDEEIYERAILLRNHAIETTGIETFGDLDYKYDIVDIGCEYAQNELNASFLIAQLEKLDSFIQRKKEIAKVYNRELKGVKHITIPEKVREHIYSLYMIKVDKNRDSFARDLKKKGIYTYLHFTPMHLLSYYKNKYSLKVNNYPKALRNYQQILSLPTYPSLKDSDIQYICDNIRNLANRRV